MSRTDKDKPMKYVLLEYGPDDPEVVNPGWRIDKRLLKYRYWTRRNAGKVNLTKGYEDGPGGKSCSCCGVQHDYKGMMRRDAKRAIALALEEMKVSLGDNVCECDVCLSL